MIEEKLQVGEVEPLEEQELLQKVANHEVIPGGVGTGGVTYGTVLANPSSTGIGNFDDAGDLVTVNEASVNALNLTNAPAEANADVTLTNETFGTESDINVLDTTNAPADAGATLQTSVTQTAGENIAIRDCVSMGHAGTEVGSIVLEDSWADQANAATNYGTSNQFSVGADAAGNLKYGYVKIAIPAAITNSDITSVKIKFQVAGGSIATDTTFRVYRLTSDPDEDAIIWNAKPTNDAGVAGSSSVYSSTPSVGTWVEIDITQLFKDWNDSTYPTYGVMIDVTAAGGSDAYLNFYTKEASGDIQPRLDIVTWADKTKAYKADADSWEGVKQIVGFATAAITSAASGRIQTSGILGSFSGLTPGSDYYVDGTAGGITTTPATGEGRKKIGKAISTTELEIDLDPPLEYVGIVPAGVTVDALSTWISRDVSAAIPRRAKLIDVLLNVIDTKIIGARKNDSGLARYITGNVGGGQKQFFNMQTEVSIDDDGNRTIENYSSDATNVMTLVGYWI